MNDLSIHGTAAAKANSLRGFLFDTRYADLPAPVVAQAKRCLLDLIGVAAAGSRMPVSRIMRQYAADHLVARKNPVRLMFDGRKVSLAAAAMAAAATIDGIDAHDGHALCKGHVGVSVLPTLLALGDMGRIKDGRDFLTSVVLGYEIGTRLGIALHSTVPEYHTSGAWGAVTCAALMSRHLRLDWTKTRHALGAAEYHGPRSQMMRVIAAPSMVKDGPGWGAMAGVSAALLAAQGYTGAPAVTIEEARVADLWADLGARWRILEQYFKPFPVCRWAQPAMEAVQALKAAHGFAPREIESIEVLSFHEAVALATRAPDSTDQAQYSLPFPVAAYLWRGKLGAAEVSGAALKDARILDLSRRVVLTESEEYNHKFPAERWARAIVTLTDGSKLVSPPAVARGNPENPLSDAEIRAKYRAYSAPVLGAARGKAIESCVDDLDAPKTPLKKFLDLLLKPAKR